MKCVMVIFYSLNRHMLQRYGCDWVHAPNFRRPKPAGPVPFTKGCRLMKIGAREHEQHNSHGLVWPDRSPALPLFQ